MTVAPEGFGARLKAVREHRGLTLSQISDSTKIPGPLLEALERDDLARWPKGLYRRAFFRAYVTALGLGPDPLVAEFARRFPDQPGAVPAASAVTSRSPVADDRRTPLPLTFAAPPSRGSLARRRVVVAIVELAAIVAAGSVVAPAADTTMLTASGWLGLVYYPIATAVRGLGLQWRPRRRSRVRIHLESWYRRMAEAWSPVLGLAGRASGAILAGARSVRVHTGAFCSIAGRRAVHRLRRALTAASEHLDLSILRRVNRP